MRYRNRRKSAALKRDGGSFWMCYSDLMSALLLIFILVMFYSVYQYFDMLEVKTAELLRQSGLLEDKESALSLSQQELKNKEDALTAQSDKLTEAEKELVAQQAKMLLQQNTLDELQKKLDDQEAALNSAKVSLDDALAAQQSQQSQLDAQQSQMDAQQQKLDQLVGVRTEIVNLLIGELSRANIVGAKVDDSGAIVFDSEMMFDKNQAVLKDVGKSFLSSFIPNYFKVLMSDEYAKYVSQIIIEGHTDTDGSFTTNMRLSQERANAVLSYLLSDDFTGVSAGQKAKLEKIVTVNGRSYSDPIYNQDGSVNMDASRRVVIKFRMNDEDMVNEMIQLLEKMK